MQSQLSALQGDMRDTSKQMANLAATQVEFQAHSTGLERLAKAIEDSTLENMRWREKHEAENRGVADSVTSARGVTRFIAWIGAFLVGLVVFTVQMQFNAATTDRQRLEQAHRDDVGRLERRMDRADADREEIKKMKGLK